MTQHPVLGFRVWRQLHDPLQIVGVIFGIEWTAGAVTAECHAGGISRAPVGQFHEAPLKRCSCGLHAHHELALAIKDMDTWGIHYGLRPNTSLVLGAVIGWGRVEVHEDGWRSQFAKPVALAREVLPQQRPNLAVPVLQTLANLLDVPLVAREHLEQTAGEFGERWHPTGGAP